MNLRIGLSVLRVGEICMYFGKTKKSVFRVNFSA